MDCGRNDLPFVHKMDEQEGIERTRDVTLVNRPPFFRAGEVTGFHQLAGTNFLVKVSEQEPSVLPLGGVPASVWSEKQQQFIEWTKDESMFNDPEVARNHAMLHRYFSSRSPLRGCVLDIGGGWGLFREWWDAGNSDDRFVVHDPGVERFTAEPHPSLKQHFCKGLAKPCWFVEGFGEQLPYQSDRYDTVLIAAALDHCADPGLVLREAARVLKIGGDLLIIDGCEESSNPESHRRSVINRLWAVLQDPARLRRAIRQRLFHRGDPHLHHFSRESLRSIMAEAGFSRVTETLIDASYGVYAFEATKASDIPSDCL